MQDREDREQLILAEFRLVIEELIEEATTIVDNMSRIPKFREFDERIEPFEFYMEQLNAYLRFNSVGEDKKVDALIVNIGAKCYGILKTILHPVTPTSKTYSELVEVLTNHYKRQPLRATERWRLQERKQQVGEGVSEFGIVLREIAYQSQMSAEERKTLLCDVFLSNLSDPRIQRDLMPLGLEFDAALEKAKTLEAINKVLDARNARGVPGRGDEGVEGSGVRSEVHAVWQQRRQRDEDGSRSRRPDAVTIACWRCGRYHHPSKCGVVDYKCYKCERTGHLAKMCDSAEERFRAKETSERNLHRRGRSSSKGDRRPAKGVHFSRTEASQPISSSESEASEFKEYDVNYVQCSDPKISPYSFSVELNGINCTMVADTGTELSVISHSRLVELFPTLTPRKFVCPLKAFGGSELEVIGQVLVVVYFRDVLAGALPLVVVKGEAYLPILCGRGWLKALQIKLGNRVGMCSSDQAVSRPLSPVTTRRNLLPVTTNSHPQFEVDSVNKIKGGGRDRPKSVVHEESKTARQDKENGTEEEYRCINVNQVL